MSLQGKAIDMAVKGHNFCITGQAGSGKTYTVKGIVEKLLEMEKIVCVTCTTGMACNQYLQGEGKKIKATILHSWAGLRDGHFSSKQLSKLIETNEKFLSAKEHLQNTEVLIIDEISMLSQSLMELFETVCRTVRKSSVAFGGMQVIAVGDFYQLPPVPSPENGDPGNFCLQSDHWVNWFPHHINLTEVHRQAEPDLVKAISELGQGEPSAETNKLLKSLSRPLSLPVMAKVVRLCARNLDANFYNAQQLANLQGDAVTYKAEEIGSTNDLNRIRAEKRLTLKVGCPVILTMNLTSELVNGLHGTVVSLSENKPTVHFPSIGIQQEMQRYMFSKFDRDTNKLIASRNQFPLQLSYALTIHKAQGMTLDFVEVDCRGAFTPGQICVAVGSCRQKEGLQVLNYHPSLVRKPLAAVVSFYDSPDIHVEDNMFHCCMNVIQGDAIPVPAEVCDESSDESDFNEADINDIGFAFATMDSQESEEPLPATTKANPVEELEYPAKYFSPERTFSLMLYADEAPLTEEQKEANRLLQQVLACPEDILEFGKGIWSRLNTLFKKHVSNLSTKSEATKSRQMVNYHAALFSTLEDDTIVEAARKLFKQTSLTDDSKALTSKFVLQMSTDFLDWMATQTSTPLETESVPAQLKMSEDGKGKERYVGGMCVAKAKYKHMKIYNNNIHSKRSAKKATAEKSFEKIKILKEIEESYAVLSENSKLPQTLVYTNKKQNERCSLTHISDMCLEIFLNIECRRKELSSLKTFHEKKENTFVFIKDEVSQDQQLRDKFLYLTQQVQATEENKIGLFRELVEKYVSVGNAEFRKELKGKFIKKRKFAHRVEVATTKKKQTEKGVSEAVASCSTPAIAETSSLSAVREATKRKTEKTCVTAKKTSVTKKRKKTYTCPSCDKVYHSGQPWICCDNCDKCYDKACSGLGETEWEELVKSEQQWICETCTKKQ